MNSPPFGFANSVCAAAGIGAAVAGACACPMTRMATASFQQKELDDYWYDHGEYFPIPAGHAHSQVSACALFPTPC